MEELRMILTERETAKYLHLVMNWLLMDLFQVLGKMIGHSLI